MPELRVFIDESGDFGPYEHHARTISSPWSSTTRAPTSRNKSSTFLRDHLEFPQSFDRIIVYYDNNQKEITNLVNTLFKAFLVEA